MKINGNIFLQIAQSIDFRTFQKISKNEFQLECLLLGKAHLLESGENDSLKWKNEYEYLKKKFNISDETFPAKTMRVRPYSFPSIRLSQLANLYYNKNNIFSQIISCSNIQEVYSIFSDVESSTYWKNHFVFGKVSKNQDKKLSKIFIYTLLINTVFPVIYAYYKDSNHDKTDFILNLYKKIPAEQNSIIRNFKSLGIKASSALDSQAYLYHYTKFCSEKKCLNCAIGNEIFKRCLKI